MYQRKAFMTISEFGDCLEVQVWDSQPNSKISKFILKLRVFKPADLFSFDFHVSTTAKTSVNVISKELFLVWNFLQLNDWRMKLDEYDDFCDCRL